MLRFDVEGVDGKFKKEFATFEEFKGWFGHADWDEVLQLKVHGSLTSPWGTEVIRPSDDETLTHLDGIIKLANASYKNRDFYEKMAFNCEAINEAVIQEMLGNHPYSEHELGRVFRVEVNDDTQALRNKLISSHPDSLGKRIVAGSLGLQDVVIIEDVLNKDILVIDKRKEAESVSDVLSRKQIFGYVFEAEDSRYEGFDDDGGPWNHIRVSGDPELVSTMENQLDSFNDPDMSERIHIQKFGFRNEPLREEELRSVLAFETGIYARKGNLREMVSISRLDKKAIRSAGFTGNSVKLEKDGEVTEYNLGQIFKINDIGLGNGAVEPIDQSTVKEYSKLSEMESFERSPF